MRSPSLTAAAWNLFDWRGLMLDSMVLSSMGVVFFPSSSLVGVLLFPSPAH